MKRGTTTLTMSALFLAVALPCLAQVKELPTQTVTIAGTIETIDPRRLIRNQRSRKLRRDANNDFQRCR